MLASGLRRRHIAGGPIVEPAMTPVSLRSGSDMSRPSSPMPIDDAWAQHRPYLVSLAFRMLGDIGDAEDAVQEAFVRLMRIDVAEIEDARGWLTVVTSRLCLDQIRSARRRLQRPQDLDAISSL